MFSLQEVIEQICSHSGKTQDEVRKLIKEKQEELSGLVSEEGAAYIVGRESGLNLLQENIRNLKITNLMTGMRSVDLLGKVVRIFEPRNWEKGDKKGSVCNLIIADETGAVRLSLWNEEVDLIRNNTIKEDDVVKIRGGYVKSDNRGGLEARVGKGRIEVVNEDITLPEKMDIPVQQVKRTVISDFREGLSVEAHACLVQLYRRNPFYEVCPTCGARVSQENEQFLCKEHGKVTPSYHMVVSGVLDDGYGNMRAVFFREWAEKIMGKTTEELRKEGAEKGDMLALYDRPGVLGKDMIVKGSIRRNSFTEEMELIVNEVQEVNILQECEKLLAQVEKT